MARRFVAANSNFIELGLGQLGFSSALSIFAIFRLTSITGNNQYLLAAGDASNPGYGLYVSTTGLLRFELNGAGIAPSGTPALSIGRWYFVSAQKTSGGTVPRFHIFDYSTVTWTHVDGSIGHADASAPATRAQIGCGYTQVDSFFNGDIASLAVWAATSSTDSAPESLAADVTLGNMQQFASPPNPLRAYWYLSPDSGVAVVDGSGNGANQTAVSGTSASDEMPYFALPGLDDSRVARRT